MPTVSVVIPVHGVEDYLGRCLDSVLSQDVAEVIAVDDASPDGSAGILAKRSDARLAVIHHDRPLGPGAARQAGAARATGDYIWFVDGDDELAAGAVAAVSAILDRLTPDVLLIDYENLYPDGSTSPSGANLIGTDLSAPELTTLEQTPRLIFLTMTVWSKVFRREFLAGLAVAFGPGIHEDVPVSAAALLAARRIGVLNRVCYRYRRDRRTSLMAGRSERHFDILASYKQIQESQRTFLVPSVRAAVFERAMWHYTTVFPLVPRSRRRAFFRQMTSDFRAWRPDGFSFPPGARGAKLRLVGRGAYWTYIALEPVNRLRNRLAVLLARRGSRP